MKIELHERNISCVVFVSLSCLDVITAVAKISCQAPNTVLASDANSFWRNDFFYRTKAQIEPQINV